jgi:hypothetical protein
MVQRKIILICTISLICLSISGCKESVPLYGTWSDNLGNTISFFDDGKFNVKVNNTNGSKVYEGNYSILMNSLTFSCTNETLTVVTEWDIRGNMLYIDWPAENSAISHLTLYKISN